MLSGKLGASLLRNVLTGKGAVRSGKGFNNMNHMNKTF